MLCPADPSLADGIITDNAMGQGGTSYAANAQVFAPVMDETVPTGLLAGDSGRMFPQTTDNFTDRGAALARIEDGTSNVIFFTHSYGKCGGWNGTAWGWGQGRKAFPQEQLGSGNYEPWSRASYNGQVFMALPSNPLGVFQNQPNLNVCTPEIPATPHLDTMFVALGDGSVRSVGPTISLHTWNMACMPNDGGVLGADW